jgi:hypothetical protein
LSPARGAFITVSWEVWIARDREIDERHLFKEYRTASSMFVTINGFNDAVHSLSCGGEQTTKNMPRNSEGA